MLRFLTAGESHGPQLVAILEGMPAGLPLSPEDIAPDLAQRQSGYGAGPRMKIEKDAVEISAGVLAGETSGAPIALILRNRDHENWKGVAVPAMTIPRPGHADLTAAVKYGYSDFRFSLERASARETAARVAVGAVCRKLLAQFDIRVGSYVTAIGQASADLDAMDLEERIGKAAQSEVRCPDNAGTTAMQAEIEAAMQAKDTLGGIFEVVALGLPAGLGSHVHGDRRLSSQLAAAIMSIPAMKGVEIGGGFALTKLRGSQVHDEIDLEDGTLKRRTNRAGGLEGGISSGEPLIVRAAMKPISTTLSPRASVDVASGKAAQTQYERSDFCAVPRAAVVGEAVVCIVLANALLEKLGGDSLDELQGRYQQLRKSRLEDLEMDDEPIIFWD
jgi:chorismate synthase